MQLRSQLRLHERKAISLSPSLLALLLQLTRPSQLTWLVEGRLARRRPLSPGRPESRTDTCTEHVWSFHVPKGGAPLALRIDIVSRDGPCAADSNRSTYMHVMLPPRLRLAFPSLSKVQTGCGPKCNLKTSSPAQETSQKQLGRMAHAGHMQLVNCPPMIPTTVPQPRRCRAIRSTSVLKTTKYLVRIKYLNHCRASQTIIC